MQAFILKINKDRNHYNFINEALIKTDSSLTIINYLTFSTFHIN